MKTRNAAQIIPAALMSLALLVSAPPAESMETVEAIESMGSMGSDNLHHQVSPLKLVKDTTEELIIALQCNQDGVEGAYRLAEEIVSAHMDFERMARWVLGKQGWRAASPGERERFTREFRALLLRTYATAVAEQPQVKIDYLPEKTNSSGSQALVRTRIPQAGGNPIAVDYRLHNKDQRWRVFDVTVDGVSMVKTYQAAFAAEMREFGIDGLIQRLAAKNQQRTGG